MNVSKQNKLFHKCYSRFSLLGKIIVFILNSHFGSILLLISVCNEEFGYFLILIPGFLSLTEPRLKGSETRFVLILTKVMLPLFCYGHINLPSDLHAAPRPRTCWPSVWSLVSFTQGLLGEDVHIYKSGWR